MTTEQATQTEVVAQFTVNQMAFAKALKAVAPFVSQDDVRTSLTGVMLEILPPEYKSIRLVATDGHKLIYVELAVEFGVSFASNIRETNDKIVLPIDIFVKFCDAKSLLPLDFDIKRQKDSVVVDVKSGPTVIRHISNLIFPDYRQAIINKSSDEKVSHVRLNYKYVKSAVEAVAAVSQKGSDNVDILLGDDFGVVEFKKKKQVNKDGKETSLIGGVTDIACYIMPMRK